MKKYILVPCLIIILISSLSYGSADISPYLQEKMLEAMENNQPLPVMIMLKDQVDIVGLDKQLYKENATAEERAFRVITALQEKANNTQTDLLNYLSTKSKQEVTFYLGYWIINAIEVEAIPAILVDISRREDVELLDYRYEEKLMKPVSRGPAPDQILDNTEPGLKIVNAHKMWALGYTGAGTIVMNRDSGVDGNHPALSSRWRGTHVPYNQAWYGPGTFPTDGGSSGHGTHTMGTITGMDPLTNDTIGVAPGAEWIAANYQYSYSACFQWAMNPDGNPSTTDDMPCVISNSTYIGSVPPGSCLASSYAALFNSVEAVGIAIVWSAGNEGPGAQSITSPKNINTNVVNAWATGALTGGSSQLSIASFSSRGPSGCGGSGSILMKPEASAPGVSVRSSIPGGYGLLSGTSMACPHVAGAIALLKEAFPNKTGHEIKLALYYSATETPADLAANDPGEPIGSTSGEDHTYGKGVIDVYGAYEYLMYGPAPQQPLNLSAYSDYSTPNSMELGWSDPTAVINGSPLNAGDFHIYIERDSVLVDSVAGGTESYIDGGLSDGQEYYYTIYARMDSSGANSIPAHTSWIAGGSPFPKSPTQLNVYLSGSDLKLTWLNPSRNMDDTPMDDFAAIALYEDSVLFTTLSRSSSDTARMDSTMVPLSLGYPYWHLTVLDNESPANESEPSPSQRSPMDINFAHNFSSFGIPDGNFWMHQKVTVDDRAIDPPSPPYAVNMNGTGIPVGPDVLESFPFDLSAQNSNGIKFAYLYQPEGSGDPPLNTDSLILRFKNDAGEWILIQSYSGTTFANFEQQIFDLDSLSLGGNNYYHNTFQIRFNTSGRLHPILPRSDWFIDNIYLGESAPAIGASADTLIFDSTAVSSQAELMLNVQNIGLQDLTISDIISNNALFSVDTASFTLNRSTHLDITVSYSPTQVGSDQARLDIVSDDPERDTLSVYLLGTSVPATNIFETPGLPKKYQLSQNYPNPFNPTTTIHYELPRGSEVKLSVYNLLGQKVMTLVNGWTAAGRYDAEWQGINDRGQTVSSGIYIYRLEAGEYQKTMKMILMK